MTLTILGVTEILCSFRLPLDGKIGKEMSKSLRLESYEKFLGNNFALSEDNTSRQQKTPQHHRRQHLWVIE